jgi:hypothetical protein
MPRLPSDATLLRQAKSDLKRWKGRWEATMTEYNLAMKRAAQAEQEAAEWKARFDTLLRRDNQVEVSGQPFLPTITC